VSAAEHRSLLEAFAVAAASGRFDAIQSLLGADASLRSDGGGHVRSVAHPLRGGRRIAQLYLATFLRYRDRQRIQVMELNGEPALLRFVDGRLESTHAVVIEQGRIARIDVQRNPDKLARLGLACERRAEGRAG
jgi:RNA polymerase sigma-70 factor (ECF subfamily)